MRKRRGKNVVLWRRGGKKDRLRSRLYVAEQQADAFKAAAKALCASAEAAEDLKRFFQAVAPCLDYGGFHLFNAAQEITGFSLSREFPYEDACGCFEFLDGFELLRYLIASEFGAVTWEHVPDTGCKKRFSEKWMNPPPPTGSLSGSFIKGYWSGWNCGPLLLRWLGRLGEGA